MVALLGMDRTILSVELAGQDQVPTRTMFNRTSLAIQWFSSVQSLSHVRLFATQWLRLPVSIAGDMGLIPGQGRSRMPCGMAKKKKKMFKELQPRMRSTERKQPDIARFNEPSHIILHICVARFSVHHIFTSFISSDPWVCQRIQAWRKGPGGLWSGGGEDEGRHPCELMGVLFTVGEDL